MAIRRMIAFVARCGDGGVRCCVGSAAQVHRSRRSGMSSSDSQFGEPRLGARCVVRFFAFSTHAYASKSIGARDSVQYLLRTLVTC